MRIHANFIIIVILLSALSLKTIRYSSVSPDTQDQSVEHKLSNFMAHHGWRLKENSAHSNPTLIKSLSYTKPRCAHVIAIAILGDNRELQNFVICTLGNDLAILENGKFSNARASQNFGLNDASTATMALLRAPEYAPLPPLAISPAPSSVIDTCDTPTAGHWLNWSKNGR